MATPPPRSFPDDTGADIFVREYPTAVVPDAPGYLATRPPLLVLRVPGIEEEYEARVRRVLNALVEPLDDAGKLVPYAILQAGSDTDLLAEAAGNRLGFGIPGNMTPDRFPDFELLRDVVDHVRASPGDRAGPGAKVLRDHAYRQRADRGGLPGLLWSLGGKDAPPGAGFRGWLLRTWWLSITRTFPRWYWARRKTTRLVRPGRLSLNRRPRWLGAELNVRRSREDLFEVMAAVAARQAPRLALPPDHPRHAEALQAIDQLLLRALLTDLGRPPVGRLTPRRRRRSARPVILVEMPRYATEGAQAAERFLRAFHQASRTASGPGPLVIAVGQISDTLLAELDPEECNLSQAGLLLHEDARRPVLTRLREEPFSRPGLPVRKVSPRRFRLSWRAQTAVVAGTTALAVSLLGIGGVAVLGDPWPDTSCAGGDTAVTERDEPVPVEPRKWYEEALAQIDKQNEEADRLAEDLGRTVRTVVHFGSDRPTDRTGTLFDGTIPELRGLAMWQRDLLKGADANISSVPLRLDVRTTGKGFKNAEEEAEKLVEEIREADRRGRADHRTVIGVLAFAQSKDETRNALEILEKENVPVVGTTATADEMLVSQNHWPTTPLNSHEARMAAAFAHTSNIVARQDGKDGCAPARHAVVVQNSGDLYSWSLADKFVKEFPGDEEQLVNFSQEGDFGNSPAGTPKVTSASELADTVCKALRKEKGETFVYWSARARDFTAFVDAFDNQGTCVKDGLTVVGGNELTNVALTGKYADKTWLRLYHSAHRLPHTDGKASDKTEQFVKRYDDFVAGPPERDPWQHDGHSAVSYDAFHVLSQAVDDARSGKEVHRSAVLTALRSGIEFEGATGYVGKPASHNMPPADKVLVLLKQSDDKPVVVGVCGAYEQGVKSQDQGPLCAQ